MRNQSFTLIFSAARELISMGLRVFEKMKDKYIWTHLEMEEAIGYLIYFRDYLKKQKGKKVTFQQMFGESGEFFEVRHFRRGFHSKSITFKTIVGNEVKKWVLKIGHRISAVVDFGDPSNEDYSKEYEKRLELLEKEVSKHPSLPYILPKPEEVVWAVLSYEGVQTATTLLVQPFYHIVNPRKIKKKMSDEQRAVLMEEFDAFKKLVVSLEKNHRLLPDLMGEGNLDIIEIDGGYHLMLLDTGFVNLDAPLPITHAFMHMAGTQTLNHVERLIKKVL
jgi:hypothetical protein